ncbi:MAG TPA: nuclear transport factor 2 family protein [Nocardioides sp.]|nr:nuclear transport factor 2 family protein [Nocardioides sp.]
MTDQGASAVALHEALSAWWDTVRDLRADSPQQDWERMTAHLADDCVLYFGGLGAPASVGVDAVVADLKQTLSYWRMVERRVLAHGLSADGSTVFASMNNRLEILGDGIDFPETEVVTFDDEQKITRYELYCDPTPIKAVFAAKNPAS